MQSLHLYRELRKSSLVIFCPKKLGLHLLPKLFELKLINSYVNYLTNVKLNINRSSKKFLTFDKKILKISRNFFYFCLNLLTMNDSSKNFENN